MSRILIAALLIAAVVSLPALAADAAESTYGPVPNAPAPRLAVSKWVQGKPIQSFKRGHVYVVDLWATWCAPCLSSMPRLRRLQESHPEDVTVVAMNVWEMRPDSVPSFVRAHADSMPGLVAMDSIPKGKEVNEGLTAVAFLGTSEHVSIPRTFVVDGQGRVAWIGHPEQLDAPLAEVLAGTWDVASFGERYRREMEDEQRYWKLLGPVEAAVQAREWHAAYQASEDVAAADSAYQGRIAYQGFAYLAYMIMKPEAPSSEETAIARRAVERAMALIGEPDWSIYLLASRVAKASGDTPAARRYLENALACAPEEELGAIKASLDSLPKAD
jgi:thiol-disulfide isomerase/thioredoxin